MTYILAIDQGTTSTRAIVYDDTMTSIASAQEEFPQHFPQSGWVEHDPDDLWRTTQATCRGAIDKAGITAGDIAAIGITNQRETVVVWDKETGRPIYNAIVWQDRRTASQCSTLRAAGHEEMITDRTGLLLDPYFSGTKLAWILDNVDGARVRATKGELLFGTVDCFLIWKLTGGASHATDATNAARTMLYDIRKGRWSRSICELLDIPMEMLPEVKNCADDFGHTDPDILGAAVPIHGVAGDQQAATVGQACFEPGMLKSTYGTGCFALMNTGDTPVQSENRLLTTIAYQFDGKPTYALEGSIFVAGAVVQWLRDGLRIIQDSAETQGLAEQADPHQNVVLVPAFVGLGAPYWNPDCRGAVFGLTRGTGPARRWKASATRRAICSKRWPPTGKPMACSPPCASMAACPPATGPCNSCPTSSPPPLTGPPCMKPPPLGSRGLRGCTRAFILIRNSSRNRGHRKPNSRRKWTMTSATRNMRSGKRPSTRP